MKEIRFVSIDSLLQKQFSPLHTSPVILVSDVREEPLKVFQYIACPHCETQIYSEPDYKFCPYCGHKFKEVFN